MCGTCGCSVTEDNAGLRIGTDGPQVVDVMQSLMGVNDRAAAYNRAHFDAAGVVVVNLMSSPGSGKTALLEATIDALGGRLRIAVIEGDLETENDAARIRARGVPAVQITTGTACHLDANMVHRALHDLDLGALDILFIENVGNLVCPASYDLGHHANVTLLSTTEGEDKPLKYPVMFRAADLMLVTKADLVPVLGDFDPGKAEANLRQLASAAPAIALSARQPDTLAPWIAWLDGLLVQARGGVALRPNIQREAAAAIHGQEAEPAHIEGAHTHVAPDGTVYTHIHAGHGPHDHDHGSSGATPQGQAS